VPNIQNLNYLNAVTTGNFRYEKTGLFDATHIRFFSVETIKEALETSGFRVVKQSFRPDYSLQSLRDKIETSLKDETDFFLNIDSVKLKLNKLNLDRYFSQQVLVSAVPL
jgi:predicted metal-dependent RNase